MMGPFSFASVTGIALGLSFATLDSLAVTSESGATEATASFNEDDRKRQMEHHDPVASLLMGIMVIILAARIGGHFFENAGMPAVMGELVVGVILGNLSLAGIHQLDFLTINYEEMHVLHLQNPLHCTGITIDHLARIGVLLLLFQVGLETSLPQMRQVGRSASLVALLGVTGPLLLGWPVGMILLPDRPWIVHLFLGATLAATSVGITTRVLQDIGKAQSPEARIILGAAVIDDVLGLLVLAVAQGMVVAMASSPGGSISLPWNDVGLILFKASAFLTGALILGRVVARHLFRLARRLRGRGLLLITALTLCFGFAWLADFVGLAPIVGAFAAGLAIEKEDYCELAHRDKQPELEHVVRPLSDLFVPIFFEMIGIQVDLRTFADLQVLGLALVLSIAAVIGKQICSLGAWGPNINRLGVGIGMIPRGEVGIIFASIGHQLRIGEERIIDDGTYSALVLMVMVTTLLTPPLLKWSLSRSDRSQTLNSPEEQE